MHIEVSTNWLHSFFLGRFGIDFEISTNAVGTLLTIEGSTKSLLFRGHNLAYRKPVHSYGIWYWRPDQEGLTFPGGGTLPVPNAPLVEKKLISYERDCIVINLDIPGLIHWCLNRIEELCPSTLDAHGRYPCNLSHAFKYNYLDRPVVDEWMLILRQLIAKNWPQLNITQDKPSIIATCDIDNFTVYNYSFKEFFKSIFRRISKGEIKKIFSEGRMRAFCFIYGAHCDPVYKNIKLISNKIIDHKSHGIFFFQTGGEHHLDAKYDLNSPLANDVFRLLNKRGQRIALHPSYNSFANEAILSTQARSLQDIVALAIEMGICICASRQHYLRFQIGMTERALAAAGIRQDFSLGYAASPGFRCGTCHPYRMMNILNGETLDLVQYPLILMDTSLFSSDYLNVQSESDCETIIDVLKYNTHRVGGNFISLWHNCTFQSDTHWSLFDRCLKW